MSDKKYIWRCEGCFQAGVVIADKDLYSEARDFLVQNDHTQVSPDCKRKPMIFDLGGVIIKYLPVWAYKKILPILETP